MLHSLPSSVYTKGNKIQDILKLYAFMNNRPSQLSIRDMKNLLKLRKRTHVFNYLTKLKEKEARSKKNLMEKACKFSSKRGQLFDLHTHSPIYGAGAQCLVLPQNFGRARKVVNAAPAFYAHLSNSPKIVLDFSYDNSMTLRTYYLITLSLLRIMETLCKYHDPPSLHLCNFDANLSGIKLLERRINLSEYVVNVSSKSYLDIFPTEKLVYLSPHAKEELIYNPDHIYIIGALIRVSDDEPFSYNKANKEGIKCAYLPISRLLGLKNKRKEFQMETVFKFVCDLHNNEGDFEAASKFLPKERIVNQEHLAELGLMTI